MIYSNYLSTGAREAVSEIKRTHADVEKINMLYEAVEFNYRINCLYAEAKVLNEQGTYDDLEHLYLEASEESSEKKLNLLQKLIQIITDICSRIKTFFINKFKKEGDIEVPKDTEPAIKTPTDLWTSLKGFATHPSIENLVDAKDTVINLIDNHKKEFVAFNLAGAGALAGVGAGLAVWKAAKKKDAADKLKKISSEIKSSMSGVKSFLSSIQGTIGDVSTHLLQLGIDKLRDVISTNESELEKIKSGDESAKKGFAEKCRSAAITIMQKLLSALEWLLTQLQKIMNLLAGNGFVEGDSSIKDKEEPKAKAKDKEEPKAKDKEEPKALPAQVEQSEIEKFKKKFDEYSPKLNNHPEKVQYGKAWKWFIKNAKSGNTPTRKKVSDGEYTDSNAAPNNWDKYISDMGIHVESADAFFVEESGLGDYLFKSFLDNIRDVYTEYVSLFGEDGYDSDYLEESSVDDIWNYISNL